MKDQCERNLPISFDLFVSRFARILHDSWWRERHTSEADGVWRLRNRDMVELLEIEISRGQYDSSIIHFRLIDPPGEIAGERRVEQWRLVEALRAWLRKEFGRSWDEADKIWREMKHDFLPDGQL